MTFDRKTGLGGTDAKRIMEGDWFSLWQEKTGRREPDNLDDVFRVQLGKHTEQFHIRWIVKKLGIEGGPYLTEAEGRFFRHDDVPIYVTCDGYDLTGDTHIEAKHSGVFATLRDQADHYMAQIQHGLAITGKDWCWFSVIIGNEEPEPVPVSRDEPYINELMGLEKQFWWHVENDSPPEILPSAQLAEVKKIIPSILVNGMTAPVDMSRNNEWASLAAEYLDLKPKADRCKEVNDNIKQLVPATAPKAYGHGVAITRTKKGTLTLTIAGGDL